MKVSLQREPLPDQHWWEDPRRSPNRKPDHGRVPLRTNQHILHLLLTVFTGGLWAPVWIIRALQGN
jgi:hypothetical protein